MEKYFVWKKLKENEKILPSKSKLWKKMQTKLEINKKKKKWKKMQIKWNKMQKTEK